MTDYRDRKRILVLEERRPWWQKIQESFREADSNRTVELTITGSLEDLRDALKLQPFEGVVIPFYSVCDKKGRFYGRRELVEELYRVRPRAHVAFTITSFSDPRTERETILLQPFQSEQIREFIRQCPQPERPR